MINIERKEDCFGCTACESTCPTGAIKMVPDIEGFIYPNVNIDKCINCDKCVRVCPKISLQPQLIRSKEVLGALNLSKEEYESSSSGGVFIELCRYVISTGGVVAGAVYDDEFRVIHRIANTLEGCRAFQGSKYTQSYMSGVYSQIRDNLKAEKLTLFSGTPCQIAGLRNYLGKEYDNLITCDLICHGVPSPRLFSDYVRFLRKDGDIKFINMKSKVPNNFRTNIEVIYNNGKSIRANLKTNIWNKLYFGHFALRQSCSECPYTSVNRISDITIGDFWGAHNKIDLFPKDKAISLVLVNTYKGDALIEKIKSKFMFVHTNFEEASQPSLHTPSQHSEQRTAFWTDYLKNGFAYISRKYCGYTMFSRVKESIKTVVR